MLVDGDGGTGTQGRKSSGAELPSFIPFVPSVAAV